MPKKRKSEFNRLVAKKITGGTRSLTAREKDRLIDLFTEVTSERVPIAIVWEDDQLSSVGCT